MRKTVINLRCDDVSKINVDFRSVLRRLAQHEVRFDSQSTFFFVVFSVVFSGFGLAVMLLGNSGLTVCLLCCFVVLSLSLSLFVPVCLSLPLFLSLLSLYLSISLSLSLSLCQFLSPLSHIS